MSGTGMIAAARGLVAARLSIEAADERAACIDYLRDKIVEVEALAARGRVPAHDAAMLTRRLDAIADAIGQGLHR